MREDRRLSEGDVAAYMATRESSFGYSGDPEEVRQFFLGRMPSTFGTFEGGRLVSVVSQHRYRMWMAGRQVPMGGLGGIATVPEHRRGGHAKRLMSLAMEEGREAGIGWSLLYPFDAAFYGRLGWVSVPNTVALELPIERLPSGSGASLREVRDPLQEAIAAPYTAFASGRNFADSRTTGPWDVWERMTGSPGRQLLHYASDEAFLSIEILQDEQVVDPRAKVVDLGWKGPRGRQAFWGALATFRGQVGILRIELPWDDPVVADRARNHVVRGMPPLMARVLDLPSAMTPLRAVADDDTPLDLPGFTMRVIDDFTPWNQGSWRVSPGPDGTALQPASGSPDLSLDVRGLSLLLSGSMGPATVREQGWAEGDGRALAALGALSGGRRPYRSRVDAF